MIFRIKIPLSHLGIVAALFSVIPVWPVQPDLLFSTDRVIPISIEIDDDEVSALRDNPRKYAPCRIRKGSDRFAQAEGRLKGNWSFRPIDDKPGLSLKLTSADARRQFGGHKRFLLNNSVQDRSFLRHKLASELFLQGGLPTARINFANVTLNGNNLGLYLMVEATDEEFLAKHFGSGDGNLYEGADQDIDAPLEVDATAKGTDHSDLKRLFAACAEPDIKKRWERLKAMLVVEDFASFMAMEVLVGHIDGYSMDINNYRIYHDSPSGKFAFVAHGMDLIFLNPTFRQDRAWRGIVARTFFNLPEGRTLYNARLREFGTRLYGERDFLSDRVSDLWKVIEPALNDPDEKQEVLQNVRQLQSILKSRAETFPGFLETASR